MYSFDQMRDYMQVFYEASIYMVMTCYITCNLLYVNKQTDVKSVCLGVFKQSFTVLADGITLLYSFSKLSFIFAPGYRYTHKHIFIHVPYFSLLVKKRKAQNVPFECELNIKYFQQKYFNCLALAMFTEFMIGFHPSTL